MSYLSKTAVFIVGAKRTAFGAFGGKLKDFSCTDLAVEAAKAALADGKVDPAIVDSVFVGNVSQTNADTPYIARHVGLRSGVPVHVPALTVNRLCGSGFQSVVNGAQDILLGDSHVVLTGGAESMSSAPYCLRNARWGTKFPNDLPLKDSLWETLTDSFCKMPMANTAEKLAAQFGITRAQCDEFALRSQAGWAAAQKAGIFAREIAPITVKGKKGPEVFSVDEHPRPDATLEGVAKLPALFQKDGCVTAGNASGISDGAGAIVLASESAASKHNLKPIARVLGYHISGVDPTIMGYGPVPAIRGLLKSSGLTIDQIDLFEINEAFAGQYLACEKDLGLDRSRCNVNGGAIALGHPTGASGSRILGHLSYELQRTGKKYAIGSACIGGGQGIAVLLQRV
jgi:acetyl-CoA acyltransferase 2